MASLSKLAKEATEQPTKQHLEKQKELRYTKALRKDNAEGSSTSFRFDVLAQLANVPARITLYGLLKISKPTKKAIREVLAEAFIAQIPAVREKEDDGHCHQTSKFPCITFIVNDMQIKRKHDRPLYYTGYIGSLK